MKNAYKKYLGSSVLKGLLEFLRESHTGVVISVNQTVCIVIIIVCIVVMLKPSKKETIKEDFNRGKI